MTRLWASECWGHRSKLEGFEQLPPCSASCLFLLHTCTARFWDAPQAGTYALKLKHGMLWKKLPQVDIRVLCMLLVVQTHVVLIIATQAGATCECTQERRFKTLTEFL